MLPNKRRLQRIEHIDSTEQTPQSSWRVFGFVGSFGGEPLSQFLKAVGLSIFMMVSSQTFLGMDFESIADG